MQFANNLQLREDESGSLAPMLSRSPGTYYFSMDIQSTSFLSTVFAQTVTPGASVQVDYFDYTTGDDSAEEPYLNQSHTALSAAGKSKQYFRMFHNKVVCRVTVAVGSVAFGIYVTSPRDNGPPAIDPSGRFAFLRVNSQGELISTDRQDQERLSGRGESAGSATDVTLVTIPLSLSTAYENISFICSCFRDAIFQIIHNDNGTPTVLADVLVGDRLYTKDGQLAGLGFISGAAGTQELLLKAKNTVALSQLRGSLAVWEIQ